LIIRRSSASWYQALKRPNASETELLNKYWVIATCVVNDRAS
jgi:hypothetical protein